MMPDNFRVMIPQYLAGELPQEEREMLEARMAVDLSLKSEVESLRTLWQELSLLRMPEPSMALRAQFYQKLNGMVRDKEERMTPQPWWTRTFVPQLVGGGLIFLLGLGIGRWQTAPALQPTELTQLQKQVEGLRETVALSLLQKPSASSRLEGVEWSSQIARPDEELIAALLTTLNQDQNINVRLASLDALEKFTSDAGVRKALEQSIPTQQSPLVQIALIDALVHIHDRAATQEFKQLSGNAEVNAAVRQRAAWAMQKLSLN
jgi:hypothetical protein